MRRGAAAFQERRVEEFAFRIDRSSGGGAYGERGLAGANSIV